MVRPLPVLYVLGPVIMMFGAFMTLPLMVGPLLSDAASRAYDLSVILTVAIGGLLWMAARRSRSGCSRFAASRAARARPAAA